jgi:hypothetical protein
MLRRAVTSSLGRALALCVFAGALAAAPASANHVPGATYAGTVFGGGTVSLVVSDDGTQVDFDSAGWSGNGCGTSSAGRDDMPITNHTFSYSDSMSGISGSFPSPGTASGTVRVSLGCNTGDVSWTATTPITWADATVARSGAGQTLGNDVYNQSGKDQTSRSSAKPGQNSSFKIGLQNDGTEQGTVNVDGCGSSSGVHVSYLAGSHNVTQQVRNGVYARQLDPDEHASLKLKMSVAPHANAGKTTCPVKASTAANADVVKAKLKVKPG